MTPNDQSSVRSIAPLENPADLTESEREFGEYLTRRWPMTISNLGERGLERLRGFSMEDHHNLPLLITMFALPEDRIVAIYRWAQAAIFFTKL